MILLKRNLQTRGVIVTGMIDDPKELVSCDLRIGKRYQEPGDPQIFEFPKTSYSLKPNRCIVVHTLEKLSVPDGIFATLCSKGSLTARGLMVANTKIDPLFCNYLQISVFNAGNRPVELSREMPFCSIIFHTLEHTTLSSVQRDPPQNASQRRGVLRNMWDTGSTNPLVVGIITGVMGAAAAAAAATYVTMKVTAPSSPQATPTPTIPGSHR
jgi:deoxycytidine triphosphate deaminase